jgi:hypothetical protein
MLFMPHVPSTRSGDGLRSPCRRLDRNHTGTPVADKRKDEDNFRDKSAQP